MSRGRHIGVGALFVVATVLLIASIFALFANRQVLNADNWADTSSELLEDPAIRTQVSLFLVDQVYANVDVAGELQRGLPPRLAPLAGPAAGGLRNLAEQVADRALQRPRVQAFWHDANKITAEQFIAIAEGESEAILVDGNAVVLDLRFTLLELTRRLGLSGRLASRIPPDAGRIKIMEADQVSTAQNAVGAVQGLSLLLPILAFGFLGVAVAITPSGHRRRTLLGAGVCLIVAGALVLVGRSLAGDAIVSSLTTTAAAEPAAQNAWDIGTQMLRDIAQASIVLGIPLVLAAWLASKTRAATAVRRSLAPSLRDRPGLAYGTAIVLLLLFVAWGPIHATRLVIPVLIMLGLVILGVTALRRETAEEFPDARAGETRASLSAHATRALHAVRGDGAQTQSQQPQTAAPAMAAVAPVTPAADHLAQLERLSALHRDGNLTDDEFKAAKAVVLPANGAPS